MSNRFHSKYHRANHHTYTSVTNPDAGHDPIASPEQPFLGDFVINGALSAIAPLSATAGYFYTDNVGISSQGGEIGGIFEGTQYGLITNSIYTGLYSDGYNLGGLITSDISGLKVNGSIGGGLTVTSNNIGATIDSGVQGLTVTAPVATIISGSTIALSTGGIGYNVLNNPTGIFKNPHPSYTGISNVVLDVNGDTYLDGNVSITQNLSVLGNLTYLNTFTYVASTLEVVNYSDSPALEVYQYSAQPSFVCYDGVSNNNTPVLEVSSRRVNVDGVLRLNSGKAPNFNYWGNIGNPGNVDASNLSATFIEFRGDGSGAPSDNCLLRQIGGSDDFTLSFDLFDNGLGSSGSQQFAIRNIYTQNTPNVITDLFFINNSGNVGLFTNAPQYPLDIQNVNGSGEAQMRLGNASSTGYFYGNSTSHGLYSSDGAHLRVGRTDRYVGINTGTPNTELTVNGNISGNGNLCINTISQYLDSGSTITGIDVVASDYAYNITNVTVSIVGGGGYGAQAVASYSGNTIVSVTVTDGGHGYTSTPSVLFNVTFGTPVDYEGPHFNNTTVTVHLSQDPTAIISFDKYAGKVYFNTPLIIPNNKAYDTLDTSGNVKELIKYDSSNITQVNNTNSVKINSTQVDGSGNLNINGYIWAAGSITSDSNITAQTGTIVAKELNVIDKISTNTIGTGGITCHSISVDTVGETMGLVTLGVGGSARIANGNVTASSNIFLTTQSISGTPGFVYIKDRNAGTSFDIQSSSSSDRSKVAWIIIEPVSLTPQYAAPAPAPTQTLTQLLLNSVPITNNNNDATLISTVLNQPVPTTLNGVALTPQDILSNIQTNNNNATLNVPIVLSPPSKNYVFVGPVAP